MTHGLLVSNVPQPVADEHSCILILNPSSGKTSARRNEHYAGHGDVFWRVMAEFLRFSPELPYAQRVDFLKKNGMPPTSSV
jgi:G:T/U-mismatch repair DNA glycosylase